MTKLAYVSLQNFIKSKVQDPLVAKKAVALALGLAISRAIPLPGADAGNGEEHFNHTARQAAGELVANFNEEIVVDVDLALETARSYWLLRYQLAYPCPEDNLASNGDVDFLVKLSGAGRYINEETRKFNDENSDLVISIMNRMAITLRSKDGEGEEEAPAEEPARRGVARHAEPEAAARRA